MANLEFYNAALKKFRETYGMPEYDLKEMEIIDMQFRFINNTDGSTPAQKYARLVADTASKYFESLTEIQVEGVKNLAGFDATKFVEDFEELAKARYESELDEINADTMTRKPREGATKKELERALNPRVNEFNKTLPDLWAYHLKIGHTKIDKAQRVTDNLLDKMFSSDTPKEELEGTLKNIVAMHEAMKQVRQSRKGIRGFFWKLFNREQNNKEKEILEKLDSNIEQFGNDYDIAGIRNDLTSKNLWGHDVNANVEEKSTEKKVEPSKVEKEKIEDLSLDRVPAETVSFADKMRPELQNGKFVKNFANGLIVRMPADENGTLLGEDQVQELENNRKVKELAEKLDEFNAEYDEKIENGEEPQSAMESYVNNVALLSYDIVNNMPRYNSVEDKSAATQIMTDYIMKNYSPVVDAPEALGIYANGYVLMNYSELVFSTGTDPYKVGWAKTQYYKAVDTYRKVEEQEKELATKLNNDINKNEIKEQSEVKTEGKAIEDPKLNNVK